MKHRVPRNNRLRCMSTMRILQSYLDGEVEGTTQGEVAAHLEQCRRCGLEADTYQAIKASLKQRSRPLDPRVLGRLHAFAESLGTRPPTADGDSA